MGRRFDSQRFHHQVMILGKLSTEISTDPKVTRAVREQRAMLTMAAFTFTISTSIQTIMYD